MFKQNFSQIGLWLDKKLTELKMLRISPELTWCNFLSKILNQNFTPKMGNFGFFQLIKNYAETTLLINEKYISQEGSYTTQQSSRRVKSPKNLYKRKYFFAIVKKRDFYYMKPKIGDSKWTWGFSALFLNSSLGGNFIY